MHSNLPPLQCIVMSPFGLISTVMEPDAQEHDIAAALKHKITPDTNALTFKTFFMVFLVFLIFQNAALYQLVQSKGKYINRSTDWNEILVGKFSMSFMELCLRKRVEHLLLNSHQSQYSGTKKPC